VANGELATSKETTAAAANLQPTAGDRGSSIESAIRSWIERGAVGPLERWLARELDLSGVPVRMPIPDWTALLIELARARTARPGWPERCDERIVQFFEALLRFSRPTGIAATTEPETRERTELREAFHAWATVGSGTGAARVVSMWFPRRGIEESSPPPLPAWSSDKHPLAILRAEWLKSGDFLAVDHRLPGLSTRFELFGGGKPWLGPDWLLSIDGGSAASRPKLLAWSTSSKADLLEWTFRAGAARITRTALLLRGRRLALLADQVDFPASDGGDDRPISLKLAYDLGIGIEGDEETRTLMLRRTSDRASARAYPLGLPCLPYKTDKGSFHAGDGRLVLTQARMNRRIWLPILLSWDAARNRKPVQWRALTVSERSKVCPPGVAFAVRTRWGQDESVVIYRSLAKPGLRAFLGHQTRARFLVGTFSADGVLKPLVSLE
jgi:hypothetical protein